MADPWTNSERFLAELASLLDGSRRDRRRLCEELAAHLADARSGGLDEARALEQLGTAQSLAADWNARCARRSTQRRVRVGSVVAVAAAASLLAVVQYAQGAPSGKSRQAPATTVQRPQARRVSRQVSTPSLPTRPTGGSKEARR